MKKLLVTGGSGFIGSNLIKYLLKNQGMTIKGAKKVLKSLSSFNLDDLKNKSINRDKSLQLKDKISKISKLIKEIKGLK